jgi:hypothetical protein
LLEEQTKLKNYEKAKTASKVFVRPKPSVPLFEEEEDDYSLIESQLEKQRRLKLKEDHALKPE